MKLLKIILRLLIYISLIIVVVVIICLLKNNIVYYPIKLDSEKITKVEIIYLDLDNDEDYKIEITEKEQLKEFVNRITELKGTKGYSRKKTEANKLTYIYIYYGNDNGYDCFYITGNNIKFDEGTKIYTMKDKQTKEYYEYIKSLCDE